MAVAWVGQIRFAMTVMGWPLPAAIVFAAGFELSTAYVARLDWLSRAAGDSALLFRGATWGFAVGAATMNYWHAAGPGFAPNGEAVSYGLMSVTGVVLWELLSTYRHRTALRAEGRLPAARPRFGLARWIWFNKLTRVAWLLTLRDGYTTTDLAWRAALGAVDLYGSAKDARKAVRAGRPVPRPEPFGNESADQRDTGPGDEQRDLRTRHGDRNITQRVLERDVPMPDGQRDNPAGRDCVDSHPGQCAADVQRRVPDLASAYEAPTNQPDHRPDDQDETNGPAPDADPDRAGDQGSAHQDRAPADDRDGEHEQRETGGHEPGGGSGRGAARHRTGEGAVGIRMLTYALERLAQGAPVTGADLDRQFGTRDYGRKVLRRLAAGS